jgi:hypothetical protein
VAPVGPSGPAKPCAPVAPGWPNRSISSTAGWLVVVFSLLSIKIEVEDVAAVTMNPSFGAPFNHA